MADETKSLAEFVRETRESIGFSREFLAKRTNLSEDVVQNVRSVLKQHIFDTIIPRNIRLAEAPSRGLPINEYDSRSAGAEAYSSLAKELIRKNKQ